MSNQNPDNRSASQKIADLENATISLYQTIDNLVRDLGTAKEAIKLLGNKLDAVVKASSTGQALSDDVISKIMIQNNCEELANRVKTMVAQGILTAQEQVAEDSFLVGEELNDTGETVNPRLQFGLYALQPELRAKFIGAKIGDVLNLQEGKLKFKVVETYQIQTPKQPDAPAPEAQTEQAPAAEAAPAPEAAPEAAQAAT